MMTLSPVLLIAAPLLLAFLSILSKKVAPILLVVASLFNIAVLFFIPAGIVNIGGFDQPVGINLFVDNFSFYGLLAVNVLFAIVVILNLKNYPKYSTVLLVSLAALNGLLLTGDLFNLFVFLEIASISAYLITSSNKKPSSTFKYLVLGSLGSSLYLFGLIILYAMFGTLNLMDMIHQIDVANAPYTSLILPFFLMFAGIGVEAKLLPFNSWAKPIFEHSNTLSGPMIGSVYAATMSLVMARLITNLFAFEGTLLTVVTVLLVAGVVLGEVMAFSTKNIREILLYSSISQVSIAMLLFLNQIGWWGFFLVLVNAFSKLVLFFIINHAVKDSNDDSLHGLKGLFRKNIVVGVIFTIVSLSVAGLPLFVGFIIKLNYMTILAVQGQIWLVAIILLATVVEGIYFIRLLVKLWYKEEGEDLSVHFPLVYKLIFGAIALAILAFGLYSTPLTSVNTTLDSVGDQIEVIYNE